MGVGCLLFALRMCVCITTPCAGLCTAHVLESATPEGLEAASWVTNFAKEQQMRSLGTVFKLLLLESSSVVYLTCAPSRVKVSEMVDAVWILLPADLCNDVRKCFFLSCLYSSTAHNLDWMVIKLKVSFGLVFCVWKAGYSAAFTAHQGKILALKRFNRAPVASVEHGKMHKGDLENVGYIFGSSLG